MKRTIMAMSVFAASTQAAAIELTDYQITDSAFDEAYIDFSVNANSGNQDQTSYSAFLAATYDKRQSSKQQVWGLSADANINARRGGNDGDNLEDEIGLSLTANTDVYFNRNNDKLFYFGAGSYDHRESAIDDNFGLTLGLGYGRVWNATPLAKALRMQAALNDSGLLSSEMNDNDLLALADIISREDEFRSKHGADDYKGEWYAAMDTVISASGLLSTDNLTAFGTVKLDQVLFSESISQRRHGWLVRGGAGFQSTDLTGLTDNDPKLTFQAEYARPVGLVGQWIDTTTYEPVFGDNTVHTLNNRLTYSHEISDRIDWINGWSLSALQADDASDARFISNTLSSSFNFELANQLDLNLTLAVVDETDRPNVNRTNDDISTSFRTVISYRLK